MGCSSSQEEAVAKTVHATGFTPESVHDQTQVANQIKIICEGLKSGAPSLVIQALLKLENLKLEIPDPFTPAQLLIDAMESDARGGRLPERFYVQLMRLLSFFANAVICLDLKADSKKQTDETKKFDLLKTLGQCGTIKGNQKIFQVQFGFYLESAQTAVKLMEDNHAIDWGTHIIDVVQTASALTIGIGENKLGELGNQLFEFVKDKVNDELSRMWYLPVLEITAKRRLAHRDPKCLEALFSDFEMALAKKMNWKIIHAYLTLFADVADRGTDDVRRLALDKILDPALWGKLKEDENKEELQYCYCRFACAAHSDENRQRAQKLLSDSGELKHKEDIMRAYEIDAKSYTADYQEVRTRLDKYRKERIGRAFEGYSPTRGLKTSKDPESAAFDLEKEVINEFLKKDDAKVMMIGGAEKAGKTWFGAYLESKLLKEYPTENGEFKTISPVCWFPIYKDLAESADAVHKLIEDLQADLDMKSNDPKNMEYFNCLKEYPILLILDNYHMLGEEGKNVRKNLWDTNKFAKQWPRVKMLILCQSDKMTPELLKLFTPTAGIGGPGSIHTGAGASKGPSHFFIHRSMVPCKVPAEGGDA